MKSIRKGKPVILYVDDDEDDRMLLEDTFHMVVPDYKVETVQSGFEVMDYLKNNNNHLPCLLIVDLNMPIMTGKDVIHQLKTDSQYKDLQIVAFTTSSDPNDKADCARYGVDMITKPLNLREFEKAASRLAEYCRP